MIGDALPLSTQSNPFTSDPAVPKTRWQTIRPLASSLFGIAAAVGAIAILVILAAPIAVPAGCFKALLVSTLAAEVIHLVLKLGSGSYARKTMGETPKLEENFPEKVLIVKLESPPSKEENPKSPKEDHFTPKALCFDTPKETPKIEAANLGEPWTEETPASSTPLYSKPQESPKRGEETPIVTPLEVNMWEKFIEETPGASTPLYSKPQESPKRREETPIVTALEVNMWEKSIEEAPAPSTPLYTKPQESPKRREETPFVVLFEVQKEAEIPKSSPVSVTPLYSKREPSSMKGKRGGKTPSSPLRRGSKIVKKESRSSPSKPRGGRNCACCSIRKATQKVKQ